MNEVRPVFKKFLIMAVVAYVIGTCAMIAELYYKAGRMEHALIHMTCDKLGHK